MITMTSHQKRMTYIKNILFPCLIFSMITGMVTGALIFLFRGCSSFLMGISSELYAYIRKEPTLLPCLLLGAAFLGLLSAFILRHTKNCRGGGIPTSVAILRGLIEFRWLKSIFYLFASASLTFFGGIPLGNEGPSVQMGTAVGRGTVRIFAKKNKAWDRYIMTGGACGGFAAATGAPLTGIIFAFEEAHRRFSPMLFLTAAMTVTSATATMRLLCGLVQISPYMFDLSFGEALPLSYLWAAVLIGVLCGVGAVFFTDLYAVIGRLVHQGLRRLSFTAKIVGIFVLVALAGFASAEWIGSGHDIIHSLLQGNGIWYVMILTFCVRALFLMLANHAGISGGIFVPTLTFGALLGALFARAAVGMGLLPELYFAVCVIVGMASFLAASSRTPITAVTFAIEALAGLSNLLPVIVGVTLAYLVIETVGVLSLHDRVIEQKVTAFRQGKESVVVDTFVKISPDAFAVGKEVRDILWPPTCTVLSVKKSSDFESFHAAGILDVGDILHIHYQTYEPQTTLDAIEAIVGTQTEMHRLKTHTVNEKNHIVPEL